MQSLSSMLTHHEATCSHGRAADLDCMTRSLFVSLYKLSIVSDAIEIGLQKDYLGTLRLMATETTATPHAHVNYYQGRR